MAEYTDYVLDSHIECERQERQALLQGPDCILKHFSSGHGLRILDGGSGCGAAARLLAKTFPQAEVVGVDFNPNYVNYARRRAAEENLENLTFQVADLADLPFGPASFDIVWSQFVLYFVPDPLRVLTELRRVTRPGGKIISRTHEYNFTINYPEDEQLQPLLERMIAALIPGWYGKKLPSLFKSAGLVNVDIEIETDRIYTVIGSVNAAQRRNIKEVMAGPIKRLDHIFGGADGATAFLANWLAYLDREDTNTIVMCWVAKGTVPTDD